MISDFRQISVFANKNIIIAIFQIQASFLINSVEKVLPFLSLLNMLQEILSERSKCGIFFGITLQSRHGHFYCLPFSC
jgi:hypothetical protein